ncbi:hypothetical protein AALA79_10470, partial [Lachnospiraceae bacterium 64-25]
YGEEIVKEWGEVTLVEMMEKMHGLPVGYADEETINMLGLCQTEEDRIFVGLLMQGKYDEAFALAPGELSLEVSYILADYAAHLIRYDRRGRYREGEEEFTAFNNAVLAADTYICYMQNGTWVQGDRQYRDEYQNMLIQGSALLLQGEAVRLSVQNPNEEDYDKSYYLSCFSSHAIWCTQDDVTAMLHRSGEDIWYKFKDMHFNANRTIQFTINHSSPTGGTNIDEAVTISWMATSDDVLLVHDQAELRRAKEERENLINNYIYNLCKDGGLSVMSVYAPMAAVALSLLSMTLEESVGTISGASAFMSDNLQKAAFGAGNAFAKDTINTIVNLHQAVGRMDALNRDKLMEMVGNGAYYETEEGGTLKESDYNIAFVGIYNPDALRALDYWSRHGALEWSEYNDGEMESMIEILDNRIRDAGNIREKEMWNSCRDMLTGGIIISEKNCDMEYFNDLITEVDGIGITVKLGLKNSDNEGRTEKNEEQMIERVENTKVRDASSVKSLKTQFKEFIWDEQGVVEELTGEEEK